VGARRGGPLIDSFLGGGGKWADVRFLRSTKNLGHDVVAARISDKKGKIKGDCAGINEISGKSVGGKERESTRLEERTVQLLE